MYTAIYVGKLLGIVPAIWFLFYQKKVMPDLQKWRWNFGISLLFLFAVFGCGKLQSGLNTELRKEETGCWKVDAREICNDAIWRFISHRELRGKVAETRREVGMIAVKGAYKINWYNETGKRLRVNYGLRFWDANKLEIARHNPRGGSEFVILPSVPKEISGTFELKVDNLDAANSISRMRVFASFQKIDAD